jgi:hypothetical protein
MTRSSAAFSTPTRGSSPVDVNVTSFIDFP